MEREVTLQQMLEARELRVARQRRLLRQYGWPLVSFTMNIPGPVKRDPLIHRAFQTGRLLLEEQLKEAGMPVLERRTWEAVTGCEAFYVVQAAPAALKRMCMEVEDGCSMGRLFDLDVLEAGGRKVSRTEVGGEERTCMVCGKPGRGCAARRVHAVPELQLTAQNLMKDYFRRTDRTCAAALACQSLVEEACTTPKPGLVDRNNSGSHQDMDLDTFLISAHALQAYFERCAAIGQETQGRPPEETFRHLREAGLEAERAMYAATGGVNTHKGAIFTLGTVCGAVGRLWHPEAPCRDPAALLALCGQMTREAVESDFAALAEEAPGDARTAGQRLYLEYGLRGIRGEVAGGLRNVLQVGLPALEAALADGRSWNDAGVIALLHLIAHVEDTNLVTRGGPEGAKAAASEAAALLSAGTRLSMEAVAQLDQRFIRRNLSPGGCADLLAVTYFLWRWEREDAV